MISKALSIAAFLLVAAAMTASGASAKTVSIRGNSPQQLKGKCDQAGGVFMPPSESNGSYGCVNSKGHGVYCGGNTAAQKKTCATFIIVRPKAGGVVARPGGRLLTR